MFYRTAVLCFVFAFIVPADGFASDLPIPPEVLSAWRANEEGRGSLAYSFSSNVGKSHLQWSVIFSRYGMYSEKLNKSNGLKTRTVVNDSYAFQVTDKEGTYFLSRARRPNQQRTDFENLLGADMELACPDRFPLGISLSDYARADLFEKVNETRTDSDLSISLRCKECEHEILKPGSIYTLRLDPKMQYRVREATMETANGTVKAEIDYEEIDQLGAMPVRLRISSQYEGYPESKQDYALSPPIPVSPSREEFFLEYYGIPESAIGIKRFSLFSGFGAAILFAVIGVGSFVVWLRKLRTA